MEADWIAEELDVKLGVIFLVSLLLAISGLAAVTMLITEIRGHVGPPDEQMPSSASGSKGTALKDRLGGVQSHWWARIGLALVAAAVVTWVTRWPVLALAAAAMVLAWPSLTAGRRDEAKEIKVLAAVVVWTQGLRDTVAGGASLDQAIGVSVEKAPPALKEGLEAVQGRLRVREPLDRALAPMQEIPGADFVTAALTLAARRRGDRLTDVLSGIVDTCSQEVNQRRQILAARAGIHRSVQIIMGMTVAIIAWMVTFGAAYMEPYDTAGGQGVLALVVGVIAVGFIWLARLDTTANGPRFFTPALTRSEKRIVAVLARPASWSTDSTGGDSGTSIRNRADEEPRSWS